MSKPRKSERQQFAETRIADVISAAEQGEGWRSLADKWGVTRPCALQWAQANVDGDICERVGRAGVRTSGNKIKKRKYEYRATHSVRQRHIYGDIVPRFTHCIEVNGWTGRECGRATKDGAQRCEACRNKPKPRASRYSSAKTVKADG